MFVAGCRDKCEHNCNLLLTRLNLVISSQICLNSIAEYSSRICKGTV